MKCLRFLLIKVLVETLLKHTELHEKIAENINLVRKKSDTPNKLPTTVEDKDKFSSEMDAAIDALNITENDPIFHELLNELVG